MPKGEITPTTCLIQALCLLGIFLAASWAINPLCGLLSLAVGTALVLYSLTKRITPLCHLVLGIIFFFAPFCSWAAITGEIGIEPLLFSFALFFSIAASDIIYACQDEEFDRDMGLYSIPARVGTTRALMISALFHGASALMIWVEGFLLESMFLYAAAVVVACAYSFSYMKLLSGQISYMAAFMRMNALSGAILFIFILLELYGALCRRNNRCVRRTACLFGN